MSTYPSQSANSVPEQERPHLIVFLLAAYSFLVVEVSLYPFVAWRWPAGSLFGFLVESWPRYLWFWEIPLNIAGYLPLGFLLAFSLRPRYSMALVLLLSTIAGFALSLCVETLQNFLPTRISSNLDLAANSLGALLGACAAMYMHEFQGLKSRLRAFASRVLVDGIRGDLGAALIIVWLFTQWNPEIGLFGTSTLGALRSVEDVPTLSAAQYICGDIALTASNLLLLCALLRILSAAARSGAKILATLFIYSAVSKIIAGAYLLRVPAPWTWVTPGALIGAGVGLTLALLWHRWQVRHAKWVGAAAALVVLTISWWMPPNPYREVIVQLPSHGHLSNLIGATWWTAQGWSWIVLLFLLGLSSPSPFRGALTNART